MYLYLYLYNSIQVVIRASNTRVRLLIVHRCHLLFVALGALGIPSYYRRGKWLPSPLLPPHLSAPPSGSSSVQSSSAETLDYQMTARGTARLATPNPRLPSAYQPKHDWNPRCGSWWVGG